MGFKVVKRSKPVTMWGRPALFAVGERDDWETLTSSQRGRYGRYLIWVLTANGDLWAALDTPGRLVTRDAASAALDAVLARTDSRYREES